EPVRPRYCAVPPGTSAPGQAACGRSNRKLAWPRSEQSRAVANLRHGPAIRRSLALNWLLNIALHSTTAAVMRVNLASAIVEPANNRSVDWGFPPLPTARLRSLKNATQPLTQPV